MTYVPDKGDLICLNLNPSSEKESIKSQTAFVISRKAFNKHVGLAIVAPITSTIRGIKLEVVLPDKLKTTGSILVYQLKALDVTARQAKLIEKAPQDIIDHVTRIAETIIA